MFLKDLKGFCVWWHLTIGAVGVLQAETGLVSLSHLRPIEGEQIVVGEHLNAVVVSGNNEWKRSHKIKKKNPDWLSFNILLWSFSACFHIGMKYDK